jgi:hypothetical protein
MQCVNCVLCRSGCILTRVALHHQQTSNFPKEDRDLIAIQVSYWRSSVVPVKQLAAVLRVRNIFKSYLQAAVQVNTLYVCLLTTSGCSR